MNENAKAWLEALRSGKYAQTTFILKDRKGFCCLGVACEISGLGEFVQKPDSSVLHFKCANGTFNSGNWPGKVQMHFGVSENSVTLDAEDEKKLNSSHTGLRSLNDQHGYNFAQIAGSLNDQHGYNFAQIADFIEKYQDQIFGAPV